MSVASAGVKLAERIFGKLADRSALVLAQEPSASKSSPLSATAASPTCNVMNRSHDRVQALAKQFGARVIEWGNWKPLSPFQTS